MGERLRIGNIVDRDKVYVLIAECGAKNVATDTSKAVDAHFDCHSMTSLLEILSVITHVNRGSCRNIYRTRLTVERNCKIMPAGQRVKPAFVKIFETA